MVDSPIHISRRVLGAEIGGRRKEGDQNVLWTDVHRRRLLELESMNRALGRKN